MTSNIMPSDGFKDRIYHVEQETPEEREKREAEEAEQERVERLRSTYSCRAYGDWVPKVRSKVEKTTS